MTQEARWGEFVRWSKSRLGRRVLLDVHPRRDRRYNQHGVCGVCGIDSVFVFNSWVTPYDQGSTWDDPAAWLSHSRRESMFCRSCCSSLRVRGIAGALVSLYGSGQTSFDELVEDEAFRRLEVAEINTIGSLGSLHAFLARLPFLSFSEYRGPERLGQMVGGVRNEDICRLTYDDASFDLVLSSDTLEHVPDFRAALRETRRVLRPGGRHVFTVPVIASRQATAPRIELDGGGRIVHLLPPLYHGRGSGLYRHLPVGDDLLTFTDFGSDLTAYMAEAGFEPEVIRSGEDPHDTGSDLVFVGHVRG